VNHRPRYDTKTTLCQSRSETSIRELTTFFEPVEREIPPPHSPHRPLFIHGTFACHVPCAFIGKIVWLRHLVRDYVAKTEQLLFHIVWIRSRCSL